MKHASILALRLEIDQKILQVADGPLEDQQHVERVFSLEAIGVGISRRAPNDFMLAVRVQHDDFGTRQLVRELREIASQEIDLRVVGVLCVEVRTRPLRPGISIGSRNVDRVGTLGAFVQPGSGGNDSFLTCAHVLAPWGSTALNESVFQPAPSPEKAADRVARVSAFERKVGVGSLDVGVCELDEGIGLDGLLFPPFGGWKGGVATNTPELLGERTWKVGRSSGLTKGEVSAVDMTLYFKDVTASGGVVRLAYQDLIEITPNGTPFSLPGDSGAVVLTNSGMAVGLHTAGNFGTDGVSTKPVSYCQPVGPLLDHLGLVLHRL